MSTLPTVDIGGNDVTDEVFDRSMSVKRNGVDFQLYDPSVQPVVGDLVTITDPAWAGQVKSTESITVKKGNHQFIGVRATNALALTDEGAAPYNLSDAPNGTTTFGWEPGTFTVSRILEDGVVEIRAKCLVYEEGLTPGMEIGVTSTVEGFAGDIFTIMDIEYRWPVKDGATYLLDLGYGTFEEATTGDADGGPLDPVTLDDEIHEGDCGDCPPTPPFTEDDVDDVSGLVCGPYAYTLSGTYAPLGLTLISGGPTDGWWAGASTDVIQYSYTGGGGVPVYAYPHSGSMQYWGNGGGGGSHADDCSGTESLIDFTNGGSALGVRLTVIGPGELVISTAAGTDLSTCAGGSASSITATAHPSASPATTTDTDTQSPGTNLTIVIPDDGYCAHYVDVKGATGSWGFAGCTWDPAGGNVPDDLQQTVETFLGDGSTTSFTTTLAPAYHAGSLDIEVNGLEWNSVTTETDPAAGEYDLDYAFPTDADVIVRYQAAT
jgi:hypothetical protein